MSNRGVYPSPKAFRRALTDKLQTLTQDSRWDLPQLQRQIAYDRLLARLYLVDRAWVIKGAAALLARDLAVRATVDIDIYRNADLADAERELREASITDLSDWFNFELGPAQSVSDSAAAIRIPVDALIGPTVWASFHVDLVGAELRMTGEPDEVPALAQVGMPALQQGDYRAYPLVDHIADKVIAMLDRYGTSAAPSTRYKDLVDLVAIVRGASVEAKAQRAALALPRPIARRQRKRSLGPRSRSMGVTMLQDRTRLKRAPARMSMRADGKRSRPIASCPLRRRARADRVGPVARLRRRGAGLGEFDLAHLQ